MKLLNEQELKLLIKNNEITCSENTLYFSDRMVTKDIFVKSLHEICMNDKKNKIQIESDDFNEYKKGSGQKSKSKRRKTK